MNFTASVCRPSIAPFNFVPESIPMYQTINNQTERQVMPGRSNDTGYPPEVGKKAHTPKFPRKYNKYRQMKGADKPDDDNAPIIHDDRNPATEEPFTQYFSWILSEAKYLLNTINTQTTDPT